MLSRQARTIAPLLFASGFCALIYQVAWTREFRLVFGASTAATAAVVAIFIGGLGFGGLLIGRRADRELRPLLLYARLEGLIALSAAVTPLLLALTRSAYIAAGGTLSLGLAGGTLARLVLAAIVLGVPTILMGGTLPAAARAVASREDSARRGVAYLYGINTLGAVAGALAGTFFFLEVFGTHRTLWLACLLNLLVAFAARSMAAGQPAPLAQDPDLPDRMGEAPATSSVAPARLVFVAAAFVGFVFFLMELVWYRMLGPILGGTVFSFGLILAAALFGVGLGGVAYALLQGDRPPVLRGFVNTCLLEGLALALPFALGDRIAVFAALLRPIGTIGSFWGFAFGWALVTFAVVLPAAIVAGYQFPLLIGLLGRGREEVGRQVGLVYAWNTAGAIAGALAGGFGLLPLLSAPGTWRAATGLLVVLGLLALSLDRAATRVGIVSRLSMAGACSLLLFATGPTAAWRHSQIGAGRNLPNTSSANLFQDWLRASRGGVVWEADGTEGSVALVTTSSGLAFMVNGKNDGNARADASTMVMSGLLGAILRPSARSALVIGLGTGGTAGWLAAVPELRRVDVVELEPRILDVARDCAPVNKNVLDNRKVEVAIGDAREALLVSKRRYDIIFSEPSNPYRAGIASLFTREYYQAVRERLEAQGMFLQWLQAYEVDLPTVATVYSTLRSVFPTVETWQVGVNDLILVCTLGPHRQEASALRARLAQEPFQQAIRTVWGVRDLEGFLAFHVATDDLARELSSRTPTLNTDDRNVVEFGFARTLGRQSLLLLTKLREAAWLWGYDRPAVEGSVQWDRVLAARMVFHPSQGLAPRIWERLSPDLRTLGRFHERALSGDYRAAVEAWQHLAREPWTDSEEKLLARSYAELGDPRALALAEGRRAQWPAEADALAGILSAQRGQAAAAMPALERTLLALRTDPWPDLALMRRAVVLAGDLATTGAPPAERVFEAVRRPFVLRLFEDQRLVAAAQSLDRLGPVPACVEVMDALEPNVPWVSDWLNLREACYRSVGDPRLPIAAEELAAFVRGEADPMEGLLR